MGALEKTVMGFVLDSHGNEDLYKRLSAYGGRTLEEFWQGLRANIGLEDLAGLGKWALLEASGKRDMNKDVKARISQSSEQGSGKASVLGYELSADGARAQKKVNGGAYLKASAGSGIEIDPSNVRDPDGDSVMMFYVLRNGKKTVSNRIMSPGMTYDFRIENPGTYELDVFCINSKGKVSARADAIAVKGTDTLI